MGLYMFKMKIFYASELALIIISIMYFTQSKNECPRNHMRFAKISISDVP